MSQDINTVTRPLEPQKRAIVIGASSGIGAALTGKLVEKGYRVAAVARREDALREVCGALNSSQPDRVTVATAYTHDVTQYDEVPELFRLIVRDLGGLELIIYCVGVQLSITIDEYDFAKDAAMIRTNLLGAIAWLNQAAVRFHRAGSGHIVGIGSIAGDRGRVAGPAYNTSKAGLATYLEALRNRLSRHGVAVTTIKPGFVDTALLENAAKPFWVITPAEAAEHIVKCVERKRQTVYIPARWALVGLIVRHIPSFIFRRLSF